MKTIFTTILIICYVITFPVLSSTAADSSSSTREQLAQKYTDLRMEYAISSGYNPYGDATTIKHEVWDLVDAKQYKEAIEKAREGLKHDKFNVDINMALSISFRALGDLEKADFYRDIWIAVIDSIKMSGDGKSFKTAYKVISTDEEYALLHLFYLKPSEQRLVENEGSSYDVFDVKNTKTGDEFTVYFDITSAILWLDKQMNVGKSN